MAVFGRFTGPPEQSVLERFFFLDDADHDVIVTKRGDHNRLGFALQLVTVRFLGTFLDDPLDVPNAVVDHVAAQVRVADPLEVTATDDALELFDVFMTSEMVGRAARESDKATLKRAPGQARHAGMLSAAAQVLFEAETWGDAVPLAVVWDAIETAVGSRAKLRTAMEAVREFVPPDDAGADGQWRAQVVERFNTVRGSYGCCARSSTSGRPRTRSGWSTR
jgi:hypothetical protein